MHGVNLAKEILRQNVQSNNWFLLLINDNIWKEKGKLKREVFSFLEKFRGYMKGLGQFF